MMRMQRSPAMMSSLWLSLQCALATEALVLPAATMSTLHVLLFDGVHDETTHLVL